MELEKVGSCVVIRMRFDRNVFNYEYAEALNDALDKALQYADAKSVVTTGEGKFYNHGLDIDVVKSDTQFPAILEVLQRLLCRLITYPLVTVAAVNGHSFGAGAFLALAHDYRVMRSERGWFCVPAVHYRRRVPAGMLKLIRSRINPPHDLPTLAYGKRYTAEEAKAAGIIQEVSSLEKLKDSAIAAANRLAGKEKLDRETVSALKQDLNQDICQSLGDPVKLYSKL